MRETGYDRVSSGMMVFVLTLTAITGVLVAVWYSNRRPEEPEIVTAVEIIDLAGGYEDGIVGATGDPNATNDLQSPPEEFPGTVVSDGADTGEVTEVLSTVSDLAETSTTQVEFAIQGDVQSRKSSGRLGGGIKGVGGKPFGGGGPGIGGFTRELRWVVKFDEGAIDEYARQLDFFQIELGALMPDGRLIYIKGFSQGRPTVREVKTGTGEDRLYFTWRGGGRKQADIALFKRANINAEAATIMHFYPKNTENILAQVELAYRNRKSTEIRRTNFSVRNDRGFKFVVVSQTYIR